jgi:hypothetical protein
MHNKEQGRQSSQQLDITIETPQEGVEARIERRIIVCFLFWGVTLSH